MKTKLVITIIAAVTANTIGLCAQTNRPAPPPATVVVPAPFAPATVVLPPARAVQRTPARAAVVVPDATGEEANIKLNFKDTPLEAVLQYLSEIAGFIIIADTEVSGKINAFSHQPLTKTEAVDLLNTILISKGFAAIRNGRTLTIVKKEDAKKRLIPVISGSDPEMIPAKDQIVTQILPIRYANAQQLVQNLTPLLDENATLSANESSNALILTDTQANIRRMAQIIAALDTSISGITTMRVYPLRNASAVDAAEVMNKVFGNQSGSGRSGQSGQSGGQPGGGDIRSQIMSRIQSRIGGGR